MSTKPLFFNICYRNFQAQAYFVLHKCRRWIVVVLLFECALTISLRLNMFFRFYMIIAALSLQTHQPLMSFGYILRLPTGNFHPKLFTGMWIFPSLSLLTILTNYSLHLVLFPPSLSGPQSSLHIPCRCVIMVKVLKATVLCVMLKGLMVQSQQGRTE